MPAEHVLNGCFEAKVKLCCFIFADGVAVVEAFFNASTAACEVLLCECSKS